MDQYDVRDSALKHGLTRDDVIHAWETGVSFPYNVVDGVELRMGNDLHGRLTEVLGATNGDGGTRLFHAKTPPTTRLIDATKGKRRRH